MTVAAADGVEVQLLDHEHQRVRDGLAGVEDVIGAAHRLSRTTASDGVVRTLAWLRRDLLPHLAWEEAWLYPQLDMIAGTPWATRALRLEHQQVRELAGALELEFAAAEDRWSSERASRLVVALTRLESVVAAHLAQEQWLVRPLLDREKETRS
jgi:iron-sulfur cluster repair protein YtfE (RIC family)